MSNVHNSDLIKEDVGGLLPVPVHVLVQDGIGADQPHQLVVELVPSGVG